MLPGNPVMSIIAPPTASLLHLGARITDTDVNRMLKPTLIMTLFAWLPSRILIRFVPTIDLQLPG